MSNGHASGVKVLILMPLSEVKSGLGSLGGVDSVCQMHLKALTEDKSLNSYRVIAFHPADGVVEEGVPQKLASDVELFQYNISKKDGLARWLPNTVWQNLIIHRHLREFQPDVVHTHLPSWLPFGTSRAKIITTIHGSNFFGATSVKTFREFVFGYVIPNLSVRSASLVTTVSKEVAVTLKRVSRVEFVSNGIEEVFFERQLDVRSKTNKPPKLIAVGKIHRGKRLDVALRALSSLSKEGIEFTFDVIGPIEESSDYFNTLRQLTDQCGLSGRVNFLGAKGSDEIADHFAKCDLGLFLSAAETFGLVPLEMLASCLPVVTTPIGVMSWERDSFEAMGVRYVEVDDVESTAQAIKEEIRSPLDRNRRCSIADAISANYRSAAVLQRYIKLYREVVA